jgi:hypothetical protein
VPATTADILRHWEFPTMSGNADHSVKEQLRDGREFEIGALRPADQADVLRRSAVPARHRCGGA